MQKKYIMALTYSQSVSFGSLANNFSLPGIDGKRYSLVDFKNAQILVIIFMCNHCPYVQACWQRFNQLNAAFEPRSVQFIGINSNDSHDYPEDSFEKMKEYAEKYCQTFPYLYDESQAIAQMYGAVCTPDIFVYDQNRHLQYHGRLDDNWKDPEKVTQQELKEALVLLLAGEKPSRDQKPSMGCSIKWKR